VSVGPGITVNKAMVCYLYQVT